MPGESPPLVKRLEEEIIPVYLKDNVQARVLQSDGNYVPVKADTDDPPFRSQEEFLKLHLAMLPENVTPSSNGAEDAATRKAAKAAT